MYAGAILEAAPVKALFARPSHPYTEALLRATPSVRIVQAELLSIPGHILSPHDLPRSCRFADRCADRFERCRAEPPLLAVGPGHEARCWLAEGRRG